MNCIGKRVLHLLFLVSAFLLCRACAAYFYNSEKNFSCPICVLLSYIQQNSTSTHIYSDFTTALPFVECEKDILNKTKENSKPFTSHNFEIPLILFSSNIELIPHCYQSKHILGVKRYLLFKQLKIGSFYQIISTMKT